jgi:hypothetical protein
MLKAQLAVNVAINVTVCFLGSLKKLHFININLNKKAEVGK